MLGDKFFFLKPDKCIDTVHICLDKNHIMAYESVTKDNFHYFPMKCGKIQKTSEMKFILT